MARLVDCCPSDDDEKIADGRIAPSSVNDLKDLVPKTPGMPSARKVRRLGGQQTGENKLFRAFTPLDSRSTRRSPTKGNVSMFSNMSRLGVSVLSFDDGADDSKQPAPQSSFLRRTHVPDLYEEDEDILEDNTVIIQPNQTETSVLQQTSTNLGSHHATANEFEVEQTQPQRQMEDENQDEDDAAVIARQLEETSLSNARTIIGSETSIMSSESSLTLQLDDSSSFGSDSRNSLHRVQSPRKVSRSLFDVSPNADGGYQPSPRKSKPVLQPIEPNTMRSPIKREALKPKYGTALTDSLNELGESLTRLRIDLEDNSESNEEDIENESPSATKTPTTPTRNTSSSKTLMSPSKGARIPLSPHRPSLNAFWDQRETNDWNDQHSPPKLALPSVQSSPRKKRTKTELEAKRNFEINKHAMAESFLRELDETITAGKIAELAAETGGVKVVWSKTLNTTAGRANWRRETTRVMLAAQDVEAPVKHKHHASIELAEKVVGEEHRLLNVIAHEFCHLANFMINNITTNPHGKEFKAWASQVTKAFSSRGITVTTKHTYDIEFRYTWTCATCGLEYKRHSKSINPEKHRCSCKGLLQQTKPVPRSSAAGTRAPSEWQTFVKMQMKIVREENPKLASKEVMKLVAEKWSNQRQQANRTEASEPATIVVTDDRELASTPDPDSLAEAVTDLTLGDETVTS